MLMTTGVQISFSITMVNETNIQLNMARGFIKFLCRGSVQFFSRAFLVFLMKESKKRRQKQPGKLMAKSCSQLVSLPGARPLMNPPAWPEDAMILSYACSLLKLFLSQRVVQFVSLSSCLKTHHMIHVHSHSTKKDDCIIQVIWSYQPHLLDSPNVSTFYCPFQWSATHCPWQRKRYVNLLFYNKAS